MSSPAPQRYRSGFQRLFHFTDLVLVECPRCRQRAEIRSRSGFNDLHQHTFHCCNCHLVKHGFDTLIQAKVQQLCLDCNHFFDITIPRMNDTVLPIKLRCPNCQNTHSYQPKTQTTTLSPFDHQPPSGAPLNRAHRAFGEFTVKPDAYSTYRYGARDPFYNLPLWLQVPFGRNILWAYNHDHLRVLKAYIGAELRERPLEGGVLSMVNRLPPFMQSAKNRGRLLALMARLERK